MKFGFVVGAGERGEMAFGLKLKSSVIGKMLKTWFGGRRFLSRSQFTISSIVPILARRSLSSGF